MWRAIFQLYSGHFVHFRRCWLLFKCFILVVYCCDQALRSWPTFVDCGFSDSLIFRIFVMVFGLLGISSARNLREQKVVPQAALLGVSWWGSGQLRGIGWPRSFPHQVHAVFPPPCLWHECDSWVGARFVLLTLMSFQLFSSLFLVLKPLMEKEVWVHWDSADHLCAGLIIALSWWCWAYLILSDRLLLDPVEERARSQVGAHGIWVTFCWMLGQQALCYSFSVGLFYQLATFLPPSRICITCKDYSCLEEAGRNKSISSCLG